MALEGFGGEASGALKDVDLQEAQACGHWHFWREHARLARRSKRANRPTWARSQSSLTKD
jgi:hypothetical protein